MRSIRFKRKKEFDSEQEEQLQIVNFTVGDGHFGTDILRIKEINLYEEYTPVPGGPEFIEGFIVIREEVVPLLDLRKIFFGKRGKVDLQTRIIVAVIGGNMVGFIVDSVSRVMTIPKKCISQAPQIMKRIDEDYIQGVVSLEQHKILLVDFEKVLSKNKKRELLNLLNEDEKKELAELARQEEIKKNLREQKQEPSTKQKRGDKWLSPFDQ